MEHKKKKNKSPVKGMFTFLSAITSPAAGKKGFGKSIAILVVVILCIGIVQFGLYWANKPQQEGVLTHEEKIQTGERLGSLYSSEGAPAPTEGVEDPYIGLDADISDLPPLQGRLVFSASEQGGNGATQLRMLELSGLSSTTEAKVHIPDFYISALAEFDDVNAPNDFFMLTSTEFSVVNEVDGLGVHHYEEATGLAKPYFSTNGKFERGFAWSPEAELLAFNRLKVSDSSIVDLLPINNWELALLDTKVDVIVDTLEGAMYPKWSPDGTKLVYLRTDGLYVYDRIARDEKKIAGINEGDVVITTSNIDLSADGKYIIWTTAKAGVITIMEVVSWDTVEVKELGRLQATGTEFYWPKFSPDGLYYAVQTIDALKENDDFRQNPRFEIRATTNKDVLYSYPLDGYIFDGLFTDDWVYGVTSTETEEETE